MHDCFFCLIQTPQFAHRIIWNGQELFAIFDNYPVSPGHALIIPKRHIGDFVDLNTHEWKEMRSAINEIAAITQKTDLVSIYKQLIQEHVTDQSVWFCEKALAHPRINTKPDACNHGVNDGRAAGRTIDHLHWHSIPRFDGDMDDPRGGVRYVIPEMGNYKIERK